VFVAIFFDSYCPSPGHVRDKSWRSWLPRAQESISRVSSKAHRATNEWLTRRECGPNVRKKKTPFRNLSCSSFQAIIIRRRVLYRCVFLYKTCLFWINLFPLHTVDYGHDDKTYSNELWGRSCCCQLNSTLFHFIPAFNHWKSTVNPGDPFEVTDRITANFKPII
jgi:hypothetical protein